MVVSKLASYETVASLYEYHISGETEFSAGDIGSLMVAFVVKKILLHAINSKAVDATQRAVFFWVTMVWFTSLRGVRIATKRNFVSEVISFAFLLLQSDVKNPRNITSEPSKR